MLITRLEIMKKFNRWAGLILLSVFCLMFSAHQAWSGQAGETPTTPTFDENIKLPDLNFSNINGDYGTINYYLYAAGIGLEYSGSISGGTIVNQGQYTNANNSQLLAQLITQDGGNLTQVEADLQNKFSQLASNPFSSNSAQPSFAGPPNTHGASISCGSSTSSSTQNFSYTEPASTTITGGGGGHTLAMEVNNESQNTTVGNNVTFSGSQTNYTTNITCWASGSYTPLVLDIKGEGKLEASNGEWLPHPNKRMTGRLIRFDFWADRFPLVMEWVGPHDGLLVVPKEDGSIDGTSLFGNAGGYVNGYEKLSLRDREHDGKLTGDELNGLYVWQDANGNGLVDPGELKSVQELGITEIGVIPDKKMVSYFIIHGKKQMMWDWYPNGVEVIKTKGRKN